MTYPDQLKDPAICPEPNPWKRSTNKCDAAVRYEQSRCSRRFASSDAGRPREQVCDDEATDEFVPESAFSSSQSPQDRADDHHRKNDRPCPPEDEGAAVRVTLLARCLLPEGRKIRDGVSTAAVGCSRSSFTVALPVTKVEVPCSAYQRRPATSTRRPGIFAQEVSQEWRDSRGNAWNDLGRLAKLSA